MQEVRTQADEAAIVYLKAINTKGMKALQEALGSVGMVKFMQQYDMGYGDYTKEKQEQPDMSLEEIDMLLKNADNR